MSSPLLQGLHGTVIKSTFCSHYRRLYEGPHETSLQEPSVRNAFPLLSNQGCFFFCLSDNKTFITNHCSLFNMAARILYAKLEVKPKWILMICIIMNSSSSVFDSLLLFIFSLVLISVSYLYSNNFIMCEFAATNPLEETRPRANE